MKIDNKTFLVTGAGSGIGKELTLAFIKREARVVAIDRQEDSLIELKKTAQADESALIIYTLDITDKSAVEKLPEDLAKKGVEIDGLINNAGIIQPFVKVKDLDYEAIDRVMKVNFYGPLHLTKAFLPNLLKRPEGYIANVSSMGGFLPVPGQSVYGASKAAIKLLTEGLYAELSETNVHVSVVFPGATNTNITANSKVNPPKMTGSKKYQTLSPQKAAEIIIKGIEKNKFQIFVGKDSKAMNRLYRLNPLFAAKLIAKKMRDLLPN